jgi:hypothetical protein
LAFGQPLWLVRPTASSDTAVDESSSASASGKGQLEGVVEQESKRSKDVGV